MGNEPGKTQKSSKSSSSKTKSSQSKGASKGQQNGHRNNNKNHYSSQQQHQYQHQQQRNEQQYKAAIPPQSKQKNINQQHYNHYKHLQNDHNYYDHQSQYTSNYSASAILPSLISSHNNKNKKKQTLELDQIIKIDSSKSLPFQAENPKIAINTNYKIIVFSYIRYIEINYDLSNIIANEIIEIIVHYYNVIMNHFELNKKMSLDDFRMLSCLSISSNEKDFGVIWKVEMKKTTQIYALKILKKKYLMKRKPEININAERRMLENIDHPFIVSLQYAFQTKSKLFVVMTYFYGESLFFHLQNKGEFTEQIARFYSAEICLAIEYLHDNYITYLDLKPEDIILCNDGHIKISDCLTTESISIDPTFNCIIHTFWSNPEYLAPELLKKNGYNHMVDWWVFGVLLYEMMCGITPFYDQNTVFYTEKMQQNILCEPVSFSKFMSKESTELISKLLRKSPTERIKCQDIKSCAFFESIDWKKLYNKEIEPPFKPKKQNIESECDDVDEILKYSKLEFPDDFNEYKKKQILPTNFDDILFID